ncbi:PDZ domain-containing protein [Ideonella sp. DXS29W]|uniref:PDZ domain-containing protein n=1 Tax=Ideonella lacteola TaxID=2984193 RepID=A0ABU9BQX8_9BURK
MTAAIRYRIDLSDAAQHRYRVTLTVPDPSRVQLFSLPVWIPGSYMVREFGRHLSGLRAQQGKHEVQLTQLDKTTWRTDPIGRGALTLSYEAYAFDNSVRTAFLDDSRGFFNPTSLCLRVHGHEAASHEVHLAALPKGWEVATAMPALEGVRLGYVSAGYDELVDHPFELGRFWRGEFEAGGVPHEFVVAGAWPSFDGDRLLADTKRICAAQIAFWHGRGKPPFGRYVFMLNTAEEGYGGLEHRASTALLANRRDLPRRGQTAASDGYVTLLGLISHEYFHTWNVKRLKPAEFVELDYSQENYTRLLWFFEGFTSYYDDLMLRRAGLIDSARYLKLISRTISGVRSTPGQKVQSVAEASFDAWVKYYRSDENTPNSTISYYTKGSLVALLLDLHLRRAGKSLDELMRRLWKGCPNGALTEDRVLAEVEALAGAGLAESLESWVHGRDDLPLDAALAAAGIKRGDEKTSWSAALGLKLSEGPVTGVQVKSVLTGSAAAAAGVSPGDELLAVDGWRVRRLDDAQQWVAEGASFELTLVRQQRLRTLAVQPLPAPTLERQLTLAPDPQASAAALALRRGWLGD